MALDAAPLDLGTLPVVLAGPILRRLTRGDVSVWVALGVDDDVTLHVRRSGAPATETQTTVTPIRVGRNLHLAVITAAGVDAGSFTAGTRYEYWLSSPGWPVARSPAWNSATFAYGMSPTFCTTCRSDRPVCSETEASPSGRAGRTSLHG